MPGSPLRDYLYLAIILMIALAFVWDHISGIRAGVARQVASDLRVAQVAQKAVEAQKLVDARTAQEATHGLETELAKLRAAAVQSKPPVVRLCVTPARRPVSPAPQPAGGAPSPAPAAGQLPSVPQGAGAGIDVGAGVQLVAEAADVVAARDRACLAWARGIANGTQR